MNATVLLVVLSPFAIVAASIVVHARGLERIRFRTEDARFQRLLRSDDPTALWKQPVDRKGRMR